MELLLKIFHIQIADFRQRSRTYNYLILLGITLFCSSFIITPTDQKGKAMRLVISDTERAVYNSAYVGTAVTVLLCVLLSLFGFYLVKNSIERDNTTRVGQIIAGSPTSEVLYLIGKLLSNFIVLASIVGVSAFVTIIIYFIRGEAPINSLELLLPFIIIALPAMFIVGAIAVLFECVYILKGTIGNIVYFFIWTFVFCIETMSTEINNIHSLDILGMKIISNSVSAVNVSSGKAVVNTGMGFSWIYGEARNLQSVLWQGVNWNTQIVIQRLIIIILAVAIILFSALFFNRFDSSKKKQKMSSKRIKNQDSDKFIDKPGNMIFKEKMLRLSDLTYVPLNFNFFNMVKSEFKLMFKGIKWWWTLSAFALIAACIFVPFETVQKFLFPIAWLWPVALWSAMGIREKRYNTGQLIFCAEYSAQRQIPASFAVGVIVSIFTGSGMLIRLIMTGRWYGVIIFFAGAIFIPSLALALGVWTNGNKLFEVIYIIVWYLGPLNNNVYFLNFMDVTNTFVILSKVVFYFAVTVMLFLLSLLGRDLKIQNL